MSAALLPNPKGAVLGNVPKGEEWDKVASEAARTIPGRENGGNCDIKNLTRGCKVHMVFVVLHTVRVHFQTAIIWKEECVMIERSSAYTTAQQAPCQPDCVRMQDVYTCNANDRIAP